MARAKRERVVQDEVEKANRRPTDPTRPDTADTADPTPLTPYLKINHFRRKLVKLRRTSFLKMDHFRRTIGVKFCTFLKIEMLIGVSIVCIK